MPAVPASIARDEPARLAALRALQVLDTPGEPVYDDIVRLAAQICGTPIGLVSLVDADRQWFKARLGLAAAETHRDLAFCAHAIVSAEPLFVVDDASCDARFADNPLVTGDPHIRFYAGAPIVMPGGAALGTVCVIDTVPRTLDAAQLQALAALSRQTTALFELRERTRASEQQAQALAKLSAEAAEERRRSAELLELVLRGGNLGLWDLHVPSGRFTFNEREFAMLGYDVEGAAPHPLDWRKLVHPDDWPVLREAMARHLSGELGYYACEHRMQHREGHWVWVLDHAVVVERDAGGGPLRVVGTHMDISARVQNRLALQSARDLLQRMGALAKVGGWELDLASGRITWTEEVYRIHEIDPSTELDLEASLGFYAPAGQLAVRSAVQAATEHGAPYDLELPFVTATGRQRVVRTRGEAVMAGTKVLRLFGTFQDVTERQAAEQAAIDSEHRLRLITDNMPALIVYIDHEERYRFMSAHIQRVFGTDVHASLGLSVREIRGEAVYAQLSPHIATALAGEKVSFSYTDEVDGRRRHYQANYIPDVDNSTGRVRGFYAMTFDISELHETQSQLELLARVDTLTGLPNRRQFDERIEESMLRARRTKRPMAVMFLDIDHFKAINDSLGHAGGDAVLCEFARRLRGSVRATDMVARLAGDEFVVLLEGVAGAHEVDALAQKIVACVRPPFPFGEGALRVTTSVGVATYGGAELSAAEVLAQADAALYEAKKSGRNRYAIA